MAKVTAGRPKAWSAFGMAKEVWGEAAGSTFLIDGGATASFYYGELKQKK